jgi:hypothetical protein
MTAIVSCVETQCKVEPLDVSANSDAIRACAIELIELRPDRTKDEIFEELVEQLREIRRAVGDKATTNLIASICH